MICHSVPIGRLGVQAYKRREIGLDDRPDDQVEVLRTEDDVFSPAAMASFEGKPFTDEHPSNNVTPDNATYTIKGVVRDVKRGQGEEQDLLLADIMVYDKAMIDLIVQGKREVSCGYNCIYEPINERQYKQTCIIGNHVALVQQGRAGERVAIKDAKPQQRRDKPMTKYTKQGVWGRMIQAFAQDASPEEMEVAVDEMAKSCGGDAEPAALEPLKAPIQDEEDPLTARLDKLEAAIGQLVQMIQPKPEPDALDALETELNSGCEPPIHDEGSVTIEAGALPDAAKTADGAVVLSNIASLKPLVAQIKDPGQRKQTSDTLAGLLRQSIGFVTQPTVNTYAAIHQAVVGNTSAQPQTQDGAADDKAWGKEIAAQYNPHYKKGAH